MKSRTTDRADGTRVAGVLEAGNREDIIDAWSITGPGAHRSGSRISRCAPIANSGVVPTGLASSNASAGIRVQQAPGADPRRGKRPFRNRGDLASLARPSAPDPRCGPPRGPAAPGRPHAPSRLTPCGLARKSAPTRVHATREGSSAESTALIMPGSRVRSLLSTIIQELLCHRAKIRLREFAGRRREHTVAVDQVGVSPPSSAW